MATSQTSCSRNLLPSAKLFVLIASLCSFFIPCTLGAGVVPKKSSLSSSSSVSDTPTPTPAPPGPDEHFQAHRNHLSEGQRGDRLSLSSVPVVDIGPLLAGAGGDDGEDAGNEEALREMARDIRHALSNIGFMYVKNHGVPDTLVEDAFKRSREFFALPEEEKRKLSIDKTGEALHGWTDFFGENTDPERTRDYKEVFDLGRPASDGQIRPFFGPTPWPPEEAAPHFRDVLTSYHDAMLELAQRIMAGLALSLDLPGDYFDRVMKEPVGIQRLLHYPSQERVGEKHSGEVGDAVEAEELETVGIGAHTDYGCIAILAQDDVGGLQVMNRAGKWVDAPPIPGTFVLNIGDMVQRLTNDVYAANLHRVINISGRERYSIPFFFDVDFDTVWEPLGQFVTDERPARYPLTKCGQHKWERYKASYSHLNEVAPVATE